MTNPNILYKDRNLISNEEIDAMLSKADQIPEEYFRLRAKAIVALAKKFGKRRSEIASLERKDLKVEGDKLYITFTLRKKHKKGLFQYIRFLEKHDPGALGKSLAELKLDWKLWTQTEQGYRVREEKRTKSVNVNDKYAQIILAYLSFLDSKYPSVVYLFPSGREVFGQGYFIDPLRHLSGRHLLRIVKPLNPMAWLHLFRETKGAEIAKQEGRTLKAVYEVRETLDLENEETAYRYVRRYAVQEMQTETTNQ